uniref:DUF5060 domain-containing protein n=1 Tax=Anaerolinea thermolimosa TaxID=229919 RepID=A0A7C4KGY7_9CHLR
MSQHFEKETMMSRQNQDYLQSQVTEWSFICAKEYENSFIGVTVDVYFNGSDGANLRVLTFYDGNHTWKVRFNSPVAGNWRFRNRVNPPDVYLGQSSTFLVGPVEERGGIQAAPSRTWGFAKVLDEPALLLGNTVYRPFAIRYCCGKVPAFLKQRAEQGFNLLCVRVPVSLFHPPVGYSAWQMRCAWPWEGSEQSPLFDRFNLNYFNTVDDLVRQVEALGIGIEMVMGTWEKFQFNSRDIFVPEWVDLWTHYLIACSNAYKSLFPWTPLNEYEHYPNVDWHCKPIADRWAMHVVNWMIGTGPRWHIVSVYNGPREPALTHRFTNSPDAVDAIMCQCWRSTGPQDAWLATGIDEQIAVSFKDFWSSAVFAEGCNECDLDFELLVPGHQLEEDQPGLAYLLPLRRFLSEVVPFAQLSSSPEMIYPAERPLGYHPLAPAPAEKDRGTIYFLDGGQAGLDLLADRIFEADWFTPCTCQTQAVLERICSDKVTITATRGEQFSHPCKAVLVLCSR